MIIIPKFEGQMCTTAKLGANDLVYRLSVCLKAAVTVGACKFSSFSF